MGQLKKIKQSRVAINTQLSTRKSESQRADLTIYNDNFETLSVDDLKKSAFTYGGAIPYLTNALSYLCTLNPTFDNGDYVIQRQDDQTETHFRALLKWETLKDMALDGDIFSEKDFENEILKIYNAPPSLYINLNNGYGVLTHPFNILNIVYTDNTQMTPAEAKRLLQIGIERKIAFIDIEFLKPMFKPCMEKNNHSGFIYTDPAMYAKLRKVINEIRTTPNELKEFNKFYNPLTKQYIMKMPKTYYKFILYFLSHLSENPEATSTTIDGIEMLRHVDPAQLQIQNGKDYIKNKYDTKLFIEKAGMIFCKMGKMGYSEYTQAVITGAYYNNTNNNFRVEYTTNRPRTNIKEYSSNLLEIEPKLKDNEPMDLTNVLTKTVTNTRLNAKSKFYTQDNFGI